MLTDSAKTQHSQFTICKIKFIKKVIEVKIRVKGGIKGGVSFWLGLQARFVFAQGWGRVSFLVRVTDRVHFRSELGAGFIFGQG